MSAAFPGAKTALSLVPKCFYDIRKAYEEHGLEGLREKSRRKPRMKNRVPPEVEEAVVSMAYEYLAYGQRHGLETPTSDWLNWGIK